MHLLLVGCGKMGGAMLRRWKELSLYADICVVEPHGGNLPEGITVVPDAASIPEDFHADIVIFAVKPQSLPAMISGYRACAEDGALFLSIAAGKPISFFEENLGAQAKIIRSMPNTPAAIGKGITVATANRNVSAYEKETAEKLLAAVGEVIWVKDENLMNPVTALSGSGPAYLFLLIEAMTEAGIKIGLDPAVAEKLARQTVIGSAALAKESAATPAAVLRQNVTSPGGTTAAALDILMAKPGIQDLFDRALQAATERAKELSK